MFTTKQYFRSSYCWKPFSGKVTGSPPSILNFNFSFVFSCMFLVVTAVLVYGRVWLVQAERRDAGMWGWATLCLWRTAGRYNKKILQVKGDNTMVYILKGRSRCENYSTVLLFEAKVLVHNATLNITYTSSAGVVIEGQYFWKRKGGGSSRDWGLGVSCIHFLYNVTRKFWGLDPSPSPFLEPLVTFSCSTPL